MDIFIFSFEPLFNFDRRYELTNVLQSQNFKIFPMIDGFHKKEGKSWS